MMGKLYDANGNRVTNYDQLVEAQRAAIAKARTQGSPSRPANIPESSVSIASSGEMGVFQDSGCYRSARIKPSHG